MGLKKLLGALLALLLAGLCAGAGPADWQDNSSGVAPQAADDAPQDEADLIVGDWAVVSMHGSGYDEYYEDPQYYYDLPFVLLTVRADGTFSLHIPNPEDPEDMISGSWRKLREAYVLIHAPAEPAVLVEVSGDGESLVLDEEGVIIHFKRYRYPVRSADPLVGEWELYVPPSETDQTPQPYPVLLVIRGDGSYGAQARDQGVLEGSWHRRDGQYELWDQEESRFAIARLTDDDEAPLIVLGEGHEAAYRKR